MTTQEPPQEAIVNASAAVASVAATGATSASGFTFGVTLATASNTASGVTLGSATGTKPDTATGTTAGGALDNKFSMLNLNFWDPISFEHEESSPQCRMRTKRDIMDIYAEPPPGVHIAPEEHNITKIHALVLGPAGTPYEGGFFHFLIQCPPDYPIQPPRVRLMTTDAGRVRFNPNLYENGKVCLSILGTWEGPAWSPAQCIASVLISIQSLLTENPYYNEPGFETERRLGDSRRYNLIVQHETIRVAVCDAVEACLEGCSLCPPSLREVMLNAFPDYYDKHEQVVKANMDLTGTRMFDPFGARRGLYQYETLLKRLQKLKEGVRKWLDTPPQERE
ncbi:ubiquitin-conjugating enzyme E2 Z-like [Dermacentor andersoni]|uniref:ubiquitin-conjugating enzyme E2 Z-like n=1 Tax=Dermacentor andersoni TaxID=34620 RepID=UPI003B3BA98B